MLKSSAIVVSSFVPTGFWGEWFLLCFCLVLFFGSWDLDIVSYMFQVWLANDGECCLGWIWSVPEQKITLLPIRVFCLLVCFFHEWILIFLWGGRVDIFCPLANVFQLGSWFKICCWLQLSFTSISLKGGSGQGGCWSYNTRLPVTFTTNMLNIMHPPPSEYSYLCSICFSLNIFPS